MAPIPFRPEEGDRAWLLEYAERTGQPVNAILREALAVFREAAHRAAHGDVKPMSDPVFGLVAIVPGGPGLFAPLGTPLDLTHPAWKLVLPGEPRRNDGAGVRGSG